MICQRDGEDALVKAMLEKGINLILPPRERVEAGDLILGEEDESIRPASWRRVFGIEAEALVEADKAFRSFNFDANSLLQASAGVSILGQILQPLGLAKGALRSALSSENIDKIELTLVAPATKTLLNLDDVLAQLRAAGASPAKGYGDRRFYVVTTSWRAKGLSLRALDKSGAHVELSARAAEELSVDGKLKFKREDDGHYAFIADKAMVFGLTLREIYSDDGAIKDRANKRALTMRGVKPDDSASAFVGDDLFVVFREEGDAGSAS